MNFTSNLTINTEMVSYKLMMRHEREIKSASRDGRNDIHMQVLRLRQIHESYMFYYYRNIKLEFMNSTSLSIDSLKIEGAIKGRKVVDGISLYRKADADTFYGSLLYSPIPFIFLPRGELLEHWSSIIGMYEGVSNEYKILLVDHQTLVDLDLGFMANDLILDPDIVSFYVGFMFKQT